MLELAASSGTTDIVATPHANLQFSYCPDLIRERVSQLNAIVQGRPRIYEGCDFHLTYDNVRDALANPSKYAINHQRYLLVELSDLCIFPNTGEIFSSLLAAGLVPVITHPERNPLLQQRIDQLAGWVQQGCTLQITAQSLLGGFGKAAKECALELLERNLVHFAASDAHDAKYRTPVLKEAYQWTARRFDAALAEALFVSNPLAALNGEPVAAPESRNGARLWLGARIWRRFF